MKNKIDQVKDAIEIEIRKDLREEASELILIAPENRLDELLQLHKDDKGNIFCLCLDSIKYNLWKAGTIKKEDYPSFGEPFITNTEEYGI
jgi:hypothetical protein